ncbi:lamin tail domain-containing protein [Flavobacteriaceae bacterium]|nr:lamin tail domain-containing protein [Flavobacteriaceae bacterium]
MKTFANFHKTLLNYINFKTIFSVLALVCFNQIGFGQVIITELADPNNNTSARFVEIYNVSDSDVDLTGWELRRWTNGNASPQGAGEDLSPIGTLSSGSFALIAANATEFETVYGIPADINAGTGGAADSNGDDQIAIFDDTDQTIDIFGVPGEDGSGTCHEFEDGRAERVSSVSASSATWNESEWNVWADSSVSGCTNHTNSPRSAPTDYDPGVWIGDTSSGPEITLSAVSGNTSEDGTTATFTAVLNAAPATDVVLNITSGNTAEVTVSPSQLTFTTINWDTPQTITATGVDDSDQDGNKDVTITVAVDDALSDAAYAGLSQTTTVTNEDNEPSRLIINEFLAKPDVDVNGDGFYDFYDDEFVEVYNNTSNDLDISGYKLNDSGSTRHVFPSGSEIPAGEVIVVFGGGTPTNLPCITQTASNGGLYLSNSGDTISILDVSSVVVASYAYGSEGNDSQSLGRDVDITGDFKKHSEITSNPVDFSPGRYNETNIPFSAVTWTGSTSSDWATATNWSTGAVPTSSDIVYIDGTFTNEPAIASTDAAVNSLFVASSNTLAIDETSSLTVSGDFTNNGTVTLNSTADDFSSLIVTGTATGDITYNRYVNAYDTNPDGGGWDLVGSPTVMTIADFTTANAGTLKVLGDDYAFSQYDNALGQWVRYPTASPLGSFTTAQGYSMATNAGDGATVAFTGAMQTTTQNINIIDNNDANAGAGRRWNLVSNPFPSYINGNTAAGTTNFLGVNTSVINDQYWAVYGWDGTQYVAKNLTDTQGFWVAPGQGFWVAAASTLAAPLSFTPDMRTTTGTGDFVTGPVLLDYHVALKLYNGETQKATTNFYFRDGLSLDLDPGYDAGAFNQSMALSTKLAVGSNQTAFSINAMGMDAMQNTRVPLEIRQNAGQAFTISIADMELPEDIYVYLEDTLNGTLTSLKEQDFELVAQSNLSGVDRFFIVFKSNSVLSNGDTLGINALNVYKANKDSFVTIAGITPELGKLNVSLYNILGQTVREKVLSSATATQTISTDGLASGLYIIQLKSGNQVFTKKIVVK